jgi:hypothetical protein
LTSNPAKVRISTTQIAKYFFDLGDNVINPLDLESALASIRGDWSRLATRLRLVEHNLRTDCSNLNLRLHYPSFRQAQVTIDDFVDAISLFVPNFCLPRSELEAVYAKKDELSSFDFHVALSQLNRRAVNLFRRVHELSNRNGEAGELILFLLTEWMLGAPQLIAKMSLKTHTDMPVHGADGIHVRFVPETGHLFIYSGESKLYSDPEAAIASAVESIKTASSHKAVTRELDLVQRNIDFSGLSSQARAALLRYLDPFDESSNSRRDVVTCLIGFDFDGYREVSNRGDDADQAFRVLVTQCLCDLGPRFARALQASKLSDKHVELFLLPVPSVQSLRDKFQDHIGWKRS